MGPGANRIFENLVFPIVVFSLFDLLFYYDYYFGLATLFYAVPVTRMKRHLREKHSKNALFFCCISINSQSLRKLVY